MRSHPSSPSRFRKATSIHTTKQPNTQPPNLTYIVAEQLAKLSLDEFIPNKPFIILCAEATGSPLSKVRVCTVNGVRVCRTRVSVSTLRMSGYRFDRHPRTTAYLVIPCSLAKYRRTEKQLSVPFLFRWSFLHLARSQTLSI